jgi:hypothetical protein
MFDPTDSTPNHMSHVVSGLLPGWEEKEKDGEEKKFSYVSDKWNVPQLRNVTLLPSE